MSDVLLTEINPLGKSGLFGTIFKCNATFQLGDTPITKLIAFKVALPVGDYVVQNEHRSVQFKREIMMQRFAADALLAPEVHFSLILDGDVKGALNTAFEQMFGTRSQFVRAYKNAECVMLVGMQVVEGLNLHDIKDSARRQKYARIALKKIQNLHDIGIVHGDAHLGNVMVEDKTDKVFLLDYGIANSIIYTPNFSYGSYQGHVQGFVNVKNRENLWLYERQEPISQLIHAANFSNPDPKFAHVGSKITSKPESKLPNYHSILKSPSQVGGGRRTNSTRRRSKKLKMTKRRRVGGFGKLQFWTGQFYGRST